MTSAQLVPALVIPLVIWRVYRRVRGSIGRQPLQPKQLKFRVGFFVLVSVLIGWGALRFPTALAGLGGGTALGVALGIVALRLTKFEFTPEGNFYTPNTAIGVAVTLVFVGRIAYRVTQIVGADPANRFSIFQNPLTL